MAVPATNNDSNEVKSFSAARDAADIPPYIKMEALAELGTVTYHSVFGAQRTSPDGNKTDGFVVTVEDSKGKRYECFVGAEILVRTLSQIEFPFKASLTKEGRSWVFTD